MTKKIGIAVVGGTGYGAAELLRLAALHPDIAVVSVVSTSKAGVTVSDVHPHLSGVSDAVFVETIDFEALREYRHAAVFLALPHGTSAAVARELRERMDAIGAVLIDLSGDLRLRDIALREQHYPGVSEEEQQRAVYGLPEIQRARIRSASAIANPGCLASVVTLAALPIFRSSLKVSGLVVADAKTGTSGAGRSLAETFHHPSRHDNSNAYKPLVHRHEPEILQNWELSSDLGRTFSFMFVPHLLPCSRGCSASVYLELADDYAPQEIADAFEQCYAEEPFIRLRSEPPQLSHVIGTNFCDVFYVQRGRQLVCFAAHDNLVKGAAGQAIQNLNIRFGIPETAGLKSAALGPC